MRFKFSGYKSVWALIAINTLMFIVTTIRPDIGDSMALTKPFLNSNYWTILTSIFVHANFLHIFKWFWVVYVIGGIFGNILFLLLGPANSVVVGASGAIFAIGGLIAMMRPNQKVYLYFFIPMPLWVGIALSFGLTVIIPGVAWQAHLGGLIVGLITGFFFRQRERQRLPPVYYRF
jgi:membrane associated rhomboid family serine protease